VVNGYVEIVVNAVDGTRHDDGEPWRGLLVRHRGRGSRRWSKFIVVGAAGQSLRDLLSAAIATVASTDARPADGEVQLELGRPAAA
jgi:hypothetical protein